MVEATSGLFILRGQISALRMTCAAEDVMVMLFNFLIDG